MYPLLCSKCMVGYAFSFLLKPSLNSNATLSIVGIKNHNFGDNPIFREITYAK